MADSARWPKGSLREALLAAAADEFAEKGFAGTRVDEVAKRASANKQLIYHYFGDKLGLYKAVLDDLVGGVCVADADRFEGGDLSHAIGTWIESTIRGDFNKWAKLIAHEGLDGMATWHEKQRSESIAMTIDRIRSVVGDRLPPEISPGMLYLIIVFLSAGPVVLPQLIPMSTRLHDDTDDFVEQWTAAVDLLVSRILD